MAMNWAQRYPGRWDVPSVNYPQGKFKNRSSPTAKDGSFCEMDWANDWAGFIGAILRNGNVTPNGSIDTAQQSQIYSALIGGIVKSAGLRDVGTGTSQIPDMSSFESNPGSLYKMPSGLWFQKVSDRSSGTGDKTVRLPLAFPNQIMAIIPMYMSGLSAVASNYTVVNTLPVDKISFQYRSFTVLGQEAQVGGTTVFVVMGY